MQTHLLQSPPAESAIERRGPWALSLLLHLLLIFTLWTRQPPRKQIVLRPDEPRPIRLVFNRSPTPPDPASATAPAAASAASPSSPMQANPAPDRPEETELESLYPATELRDIDPSDARLLQTEADQKRQANDRQERQKRQHEQDVAQILKDYPQYASPQRQNATDSRQRMAKRLEAAERSNDPNGAAPYSPRSRAGLQRTLSLGNQGKKAAEAIIKRYGIRMTERYVDPGKEGTGFLTRATTNDTFFIQPTQPGVYKVFEISTGVKLKMRDLERLYLKEKGYDESQYKIGSIEFGVIPLGPDQWDLGILDATITKTK